MKTASSLFICKKKKISHFSQDFSIEIFLRKKVKIYFRNEFQEFHIISSWIKMLIWKNIFFPKFNTFLIKKNYSWIE